MAETAESVPVEISYRAFLSYAHADMAWAKWLHAALEGFRIDKDLKGRATPLGPVPKTLRPIFRDREDFSGGHTLTDATIAALDASSALIVLCSTVAATRSAVNEEVRLFRSRHPERPVIPVIVEGDWPDNFPIALRFEIARDGTVTNQPVTILGPDLRGSGDGKALGLAKAVASLIGVPSDDIVRRAQRARRRRNRIWGALAGVFLILAVSATGSALYAWHQLKTNEVLLDRTLGRATSLVSTAVAQANQYGVSRALTVKLLEQAEGLFDDVAELGRNTPQLRYRKAWMLIEFARNYEILGDTIKQRVRAAEAYRLLVHLATEKPGDTNYQRDLSVAYNEVGSGLVAQGKLAEALTSFRAGLDIRKQLAKVDPSNVAWQRELAAAYTKLGDVLILQGDLVQALTSFREGLSIGQRLATADPTDVHSRSELAASYSRIGAVLSKQGQLAEAQTSFDESLSIAQALANTDPPNTQWQRDLSVAYLHVGDVLLAQDNLAEALTPFRESLDILQRLAKADPSNAGWRRDLVVSHIKIGDVLVSQGRLAEALESYRESLTIIDGLTKVDPNNASWQRDLSVSYLRIGRVLVAQGNLAEALTPFLDGLVIVEGLAKTDPNNMEWQRDAAVFYNNVGHVQSKQGKLSGALISFRAALSITEPLAKSDPTNTLWQRDLSMSYSNMARILLVQGKRAEAVTSSHQSLAIIERLAEADPNNAEWQWDVVLEHWNLAAQGDEPAKRWRFIVSKLRKLRDDNRLRPERARLLPMAEEQLARIGEAKATPQGVASPPPP